MTYEEIMESLNEYDLLDIVVACYECDESLEEYNYKILDDDALNLEFNRPADIAYAINNSDHFSLDDQYYVITQGGECINTADDYEMSENLLNDYDIILETGIDYYKQGYISAKDLNDYVKALFDQYIAENE